MMGSRTLEILILTTMVLSIARTYDDTCRYNMIKHCSTDYDDCVWISEWCDGKTDCADLSDEANCTEYTCPRDRTKCANGYQCLYRHEFCDGDEDCMDGSDEDEDFCQDYKCLDGFMKCRDGQQCIRVDAMCRVDTIRTHCNDGSDMEEEFCETADCGTQARKCDDGAHCVYDSEMCNGFQTCPDGSDEAPQNCTKDSECPSGLWKCADGVECIHEMYVCDNWKYCSDKSDENRELCTQDRQCAAGHSKCADGLQCIPDGMECTGDSECIDYSDESPEICHNKQPPVVKDLRAISFPGKIKVFWMWPDFAGSARGYKIIYGKELSGLRHTQDLGPNRIMHIINNLEPNTSYTISVVTYNNLGVGQEVTVKVTTTGV
ncbi:low-density lipoprotein receptor-related protein 4-like [Mytilus trossulus]|uniref:low-density lipoprotein receptor-related protein 4-like n=1 Tax=Mytilus trossulus TaxID=6551 RepID=UPI003005750D